MVQCLGTNPLRMKQSSCLGRCSTQLFSVPMSKLSQAGHSSRACLSVLGLPHLGHSSGPPWSFLRTAPCHAILSCADCVALGMALQEAVMGSPVQPILAARSSCLGLYLLPSRLLQGEINLQPDCLEGTMVTPLNGNDAALPLPLGEVTGRETQLLQVANHRPHRAGTPPPRVLGSGEVFPRVLPRLLDARRLGLVPK